MRDAETLDDLIATGRAKWAGSGSHPPAGSYTPSGGLEAHAEPPQAAVSFSEAGPTGDDPDPLWSFDGLSGQLVEVSCGRPEERRRPRRAGPSGAGPAGLSGAAQIVLEAQRSGEPCAWIAVGPSLVFPPDLADLGIDLDALPIVRVDRIEQAWSAADELLRPGGFGLCVIDEIDTSPSTPTTPLSVQVRLAALARHHRAALLWLRSARRCSQDPIGQAGLRVAATRTRSRTDPKGLRFRCELRILRHKKAGSSAHNRQSIAFDRDGSVGIA